VEDELKKIDIIRERMGISYREAQEALEEAGGNLIEALIKAEERRDRNWSDKLLDKGEEVAGQVKEYIHKGNRTKVKLKRGEETLVEFPATVGAFGILAMLASAELAIAVGVGAVAAVVNNVSLEIEKPGGETKVISIDRLRNGKNQDD